MTPIGGGHAGATNRLNRLFARAAADGLALVSVQSPLQLDVYNEPEPDVMLLRPRKDDYRDSHPGAADVLLLLSNSPKPRSPLTAGPSLRFTPSSACPKSGLSIFATLRSRFIASRRAAPTPIWHG